MPTTTTSNSRSNSPLMRHPADSTSTFMHQHKQQLNSSKMPTKITWAVVSVVIVATTTTITPLGGGGGVSAFSPLSSSSAFHRNILEPQKPQQWSSLPQSSVYSSSCSSYTTPTTALHAEKKKDRSSSPFAVKNALLSGCLGLAVWTSSMVGGGSGGNFLVPPIASASNPADIVGCLFQKCPIPLAKCIADPRCLANVVCINTCNDRPDETACQIQCGDLVGESAAIAQFNQCVVSDMSCVPQKADEGFYPVPRPDQVVPKFDASFFNGKLYITAGACVRACVLVCYCVILLVSIWLVRLRYIANERGKGERSNTA